MTSSLLSWNNLDTPQIGKVVEQQTETSVLTFYANTATMFI